MGMKAMRWCSSCRSGHPVGDPCPQAWRRQDQDRDRQQPWRRWYSLKIWHSLRREVLESEPWCRWCLAAGRHTPAVVVDHIVDHCGNWDLFVCLDNLQPLCQTCHNRKTLLDKGIGRQKAGPFAPETGRALSAREGRLAAGPQPAAGTHEEGK